MAGSRFRGRQVQRGKFLGGVARAVLHNVPRVGIKAAKGARPLLTKQGLKTLAKKGSILAAKKGAEYYLKADRCREEVVVVVLVVENWAKSWYQWRRPDVGLAYLVSRSVVSLRT